MKNRALISLAMAGFAVTACAMLDKDDGIHPMGSPQTCSNSAKCIIPVAVTECTPAGVSVDDYHIQKPRVVLEWTLPAGYQFDRVTGIKFKDGSGWETEFTSPSSNGGKFVWHDKNSGGGPRSFPYGLTILKADGSPCVTIDPTVINDL